MTPRYPLYIISKGRWESRLTSKALEEMAIPYRIVVEPQERDQYAAVIAPEKILVLPFSDLGQGSIPARNWVWEHSISEGHARHWIIDDNIRGFYRLNNNLKVPVKDGAIFCAMEDFVERYKNVPMAGPNYQFLVKANQKNIPPFYLNGRIYSCILLANNVTHRWRGQYNEDTDLSLRFLKDRYCTVLFNAFLARKMATMTMKGGNTDHLYKQDGKTDGRMEMAKSLQAQHPDVTTINYKWGRYQHQVDYRPFRNNRLIRNSGVDIPSATDEYGMQIKKVAPIKSARLRATFEAHLEETDGRT